MQQIVKQKHGRTNDRLARPIKTSRYHPLSEPATLMKDYLKVVMEWRTMREIIRYISVDQMRDKFHVHLRNTLKFSLER